MALIICRECGESISDEAEICPRCMVEYPELPGPFGKRMAAECAQQGRKQANFTYAGKTVVGWDMGAKTVKPRVDGDRRAHV